VHQTPASTGLSVGGVVVTPIPAYHLEPLSVAAAMPLIGALFFIALAPLSVPESKEHKQEPKLPQGCGYSSLTE